MTPAPRTPDRALRAVLYTRRECPLCDEMKAQVEGARIPDLDLVLVDVDGDPVLRDRFGWRVPVLEVEGQIACEGRCEAGRVAERVDRIRAQQAASPARDGED